MKIKKIKGIKEKQEINLQQIKIKTKEIIVTYTIESERR